MMSISKEIVDQAILDRRGRDRELERYARLEWRGGTHWLRGFLAKPPDRGLGWHAPWRWLKRAPQRTELRTPVPLVLQRVSIEPDVEITISLQGSEVPEAVALELAPSGDGFGIASGGLFPGRD